MKNTPKAFLNWQMGAGIFFCLIVALAAYLTGTAMLASLFAYRSPLKDTPPQPGPALGQPATRQLVFVLVDALRADTAWQAQTMPTLARLRQQGAWATMHSRTLSFSQPGYSCLLTGAWPDVSDGPAANLDYADIPTFTQDNLFSAAQQAGLKTAVSGYYWFEKLIPTAAISASFYTAGEDRLADRAVVDAALPWLGQDYRLILIHIDQVDYAGHHEGGAASANWVTAAQRADALLAEIVARLDLSQDTLLIASDHGQIDGGGHGGNEPVVLVEPFVLVGAGVRPGSYPDIQMVDVAPTLATLLGVHLPASAQGQPRVEMLKLPAATQTALPGAIAAQQTRLVESYTQAIERPLSPGSLPTLGSVSDYQAILEKEIAARLYLERIPRGLSVALVVLLIGSFLVRTRPVRLGWLLGSALLALGLFHLRYAVLDGHAYSLSWVPAEMDLIIYLAQTSAFATAAGWLMAMVGTGSLRRGPAAAAQTTLNYLLALFGLLVIPFGVSYTLNGLLPTWILPDHASFFVGFLSLLQALFSAIVGLLLAALAALLARFAFRTHAG